MILLTINSNNKIYNRLVTEINQFATERSCELRQILAT